MSEKPAHQYSLLQDVARRLLELDSSDPELKNKVVSLKGKATRALNAPYGNPNIKEARKLAIAARQNTSKAFKEQVMPHIAAARTAGYTSLNAIARYLNENKVPSP